MKIQLTPHLVKQGRWGNQLTTRDFYHLDETEDRTKEDEKERIGITFSMDYCFPTTAEEADTDPKVLILHNGRLGTLLALGGDIQESNPRVIVVDHE